MPVLLLPDLFAIISLTCVVAVVRRKMQHDAAGLWTAGLLLIVLENVARLLYLSPLPALPHRMCHALALDAYCLAGFLFLRSAVPGLQSMPRSWLYLWWNAAPLLLMLTAYGMEWKVPGLYRLIAVTGLVTVVLSAMLFRRGWKACAIAGTAWIPAVIATLHASPRVAVYLSLSLLFAITAAAFAANLPRASKGRLLIAGGFGLWALCFATHPLVAAWGTTWEHLAGEMWSMQKFLITLGFVLLLFEYHLWNTEQLALHDQLTGLPSRYLYEDRRAQALARAKRNGTALLLFNLDLDDFKQVNDTLGHAAGDTLLCSMATSLQAAVRTVDTVARLGGDEFHVVAVDLHRDGAAPVLRQAERIAAQIRRAVEVPVEVDGLHGKETVRASTSIGIALYPYDGEDMLTLSRVADRRMYEDKQQRKLCKDRASSNVMEAMNA